MFKNIKRLTFTLLLFASIALNAQTAKLTANKGEGTVGDIIEFTLSVETNRNDFKFPEIEPKYGAFEVVETSNIDTAKSANTTILSRKFKAIALDSGEIEISQFEVKFSDFSIFSNALKIHILSMGANGQKQIKDIKPPFAVEDNSFNWHTLIIILLLLAMFGIVFFLVRRKGGKKGRVETAIEVPTKALCLAALNELKTEDYIQSGRYKELFNKLSDILKVYIGAEYSFKAKTLLSDEIINVYSKKARTIESIALLRSILELSDLVKFAKYQPSVEETIKAIDNAIAFVEL